MACHRTKHRREDRRNEEVLIPLIMRKSSGLGPPIRHRVSRNFIQIRRFLGVGDIAGKEHSQAEAVVASNARKLFDCAGTEKPHHN